jgi:excisionase family DNA binding protein
MTTMNPGVTGRGLDIEPLVVRPNKAMRLLDCSRVYLYELINNGELESYRDGAARKITMESIRRRIQRKLRESQQTAA